MQVLKDFNFKDNLIILLCQNNKKKHIIPMTIFVLYNFLAVNREL